MRIRSEAVVPSHLGARGPFHEGDCSEKQGKERELIQRLLQFEAGHSQIAAECHKTDACQVTGARCCSSCSALHGAGSTASAGQRALAWPERHQYCS